MSTDMYIGVNGVARKIKSAYIGVDGIARKIKSAYIGIENIAHKILKTDIFMFYKNIDGLTTARSNFATGVIGNYTLIAGGISISGSTYLSAIDAYSTSLVHSNPTVLSAKRSLPANVSIGNYTLFAGGNSGDTTVISTINAYNTSLTRSTPTALSSQRGSLAGAKAGRNGNYAVIAGGCNGSKETAYATAWAYNTSLTRSTATALSVARCDLTSATIGDYAIFAGGNPLTTSTTTKVVDAYNSSLTKSTPATLNRTIFNAASATIGDYAIFAGGKKVAPRLTNDDGVDAYSSSLIVTRLVDLPSSVNNLDIYGCSLNNHAVFNRENKLFIYNNKLVRSIQSINNYSDFISVGLNKYLLLVNCRKGYSDTPKENNDIYKET